jgi:putative ABC transport system substrate-binding protein
MRRRDFITALGGVAISWPLAARAQQRAKPFRIGFFPLGSPANQYDQSLVDAFRRGLRQLGLVENRDIALETTWIGGNDPQGVIAKAIQSGVDLLVPCGSTASAAAKHLTASIPIVFVSVGNPVGLGLRAFA